MVNREMASHNPSRHCSFAAEKVQAHAKSAPPTGAHVVADVSQGSGGEALARPRPALTHVAHSIVHAIDAAPP